MKNLILVSRTPMVIQIFTLVCKKLQLALEVLDEPQIDHKVDMIIIDNEFVSDRINVFKSYCKLIGVISKEELPYEIANDFLIPLPFLPSNLQQILTEQLEVLTQREHSKVYVSNVEVPEQEGGFIDKDEQELEQNKENEAKLAVDYLEGLADNIASDMVEETDDSMVSFSSVKQGGVLDSKELSMIEDMIEESNDKRVEDLEAELGDVEEEKWLDLSSIIDQAIHEVNMIDDIDTKPLRINLNNYELDQLKPLLNLLDQETIDSLSEGKQIPIILQLEEAKSDE